VNRISLLVAVLFAFVVAVPISAESLYTSVSLDALEESVGVYTAVGHVDFDSDTDPKWDRVGCSFKITDMDLVFEYEEEYEVDQFDWGSPPLIPPSPGRYDFEQQYTFPLDSRGGCATGELWASTMLRFNSEYVHDGMCWHQYVCHLMVGVIDGGFIEGADPNRDYHCSDCVELVALPNTGFEFVGWYGYVSSSAPVITVCLDGGDRSETAYFEALPCDPATDPKCPCNPDVNPNCGQCDPWDPECVGTPPIDGNPPNSPIVINFERGDYRLTGNDDPVAFDIQASGLPLRIGWTAAGADEAFLCLDRNGNGKIDDGSELFGTATRLGGGSRAPNGFVALAEYDDNRDGFIDDRDAVWSRLLLWRDLNHDGISQTSELSPVAASPLKAIGLGYHWTGRRDSSGNKFRYEALVWIGNGANAKTRPVYDVFFVIAP